MITLFWLSAVTVTDSYFFFSLDLYILVRTIKKDPLALCLRTHYSAWREHILFKPHLICIFKEWWLVSWASNYELRKAGWSVIQWPPMSLANGCVKCNKVETDLQSQFQLCYHGKGDPFKKKKAVHVYFKWHITETRPQVPNLYHTF